ncbi:MBL fold metallo-hydrolase [Comamonas endophytica]|uniref:MBL fold metallo-hydrolase n=1 Tax=Comamonas endophytica TaxID=2949090 RepID=A0ABY6GDY0_9BURK|nr:MULTISPECIES: MBL fold metallo-hydrolase [unclassified Acidovorax]MCD2511068.1 MBL fold metallo-hydrolase [Acidovorax sp. D4N7]UYG53306.1 MBL fold metallo-hydrolase [Acidovorax sp. 5MLIR]
MTVLERGWLSANGILFAGPDAALVDTGYCTHADQTLALVRATLGPQPLARILNTHLHSDHCGGNAALQAAWPRVHTAVAPGQADLVRRWDAQALGYVATGQRCPRFRLDGVLAPGTQVQLGGRPWQIHAAPGHDPHAVLLFEPEARLLISADALWEKGFGVVFPELDGEDAFSEVGATLELIERLAPATVIPGHGPVFRDVAGALAAARARLQAFMQSPERHARHAAKVLLKFKLLEWQRIDEAGLLVWVAATPYMDRLRARHQPQATAADWVAGLVQELVAVGAARREAGLLHNG